jgi:hypothetical protein
VSFRAERIRIAVPLERQRRLFDFSSSRSLARHAFRLDLQGIASLADAAVLVCFIAVVGGAGENPLRTSVNRSNIARQPTAPRPLRTLDRTAAPKGAEAERDTTPAWSALHAARPT